MSNSIKREYDKMSITRDIIERKNIIRQFQTTGFLDRNEAIEKILSLQHTDADMAFATVAKQTQCGGVNLYQADNNLIIANIQFQVDILIAKLAKLALEEKKEEEK